MRIKAIYEDMLPLFKTADACRSYVESNADRKRKNLIRRRMRFVRKALNQEFNYFVTVTYFYGHYDNRLTNVIKSNRMSIWNIQYGKLRYGME